MAEKELQQRLADNIQMRKLQKRNLEGSPEDKQREWLLRRQSIKDHQALSGDKKDVNIFKRLAAVRKTGIKAFDGLGLITNKMSLNDGDKAAGSPRNEMFTITPQKASRTFKQNDESDEFASE